MYHDRTQAGAALAEEVAALDLVDPVVIALPRGGVPVAAPIAERLGAPLDVILVRKIGVPGHRELAAGALVDGPPETLVFNEGLMRALGLTRGDLAAIIAEERGKNAERRAAWLGQRAPIDIAGRSVVVVDDGIATGATMKAALTALRARQPHEIVLAVPVAAADTLDELRDLADRIVCPVAPRDFGAVGFYFRDFGQVPDADVAEMLAARGPAA